MTIKEYLQQAYRLDQRISSNIEEVSRLRQIAQSVRSPSLEQHYDPNRPTEAAFAKCLIRLYELEEKINDEVDKLVDLKVQIHDAIDKVPNTDDQMVLRYRYLHNETWEHIGEILHADESTVRRWHHRALHSIKLPEDYIEI